MKKKRIQHSRNHVDQMGIADGVYLQLLLASGPEHATPLRGGRQRVPIKFAVYQFMQSMATRCIILWCAAVAMGLQAFRGKRSQRRLTTARHHKWPVATEPVLSRSPVRFGHASTSGEGQ